MIEDQQTFILQNIKLNINLQYNLWITAIYKKIKKWFSRQIIA